MADQNAKLLESVKRCAGTISKGLKNSSNDPFARQAGHGTMAMFGSQHLEPTDVAGLAGVAETDVLGALHVGSDKHSDRAGRGLNNTITSGFGLTQECGLIGR